MSNHQGTTRRQVRHTPRSPILQVVTYIHIARPQPRVLGVFGVHMTPPNATLLRPKTLRFVLEVSVDECKRSHASCYACEVTQGAQRTEECLGVNTTHGRSLPTSDRKAPTHASWHKIRRFMHHTGPEGYRDIAFNEFLNIEAPICTSVAAECTLPAVPVWVCPSTAVGTLCM